MNVAGTAHMTHLTQFLTSKNSSVDRVKNELDSLAQQGFACIFVSGSITEGFFNEFSDLDVFTIGKMQHGVHVDGDPSTTIDYRLNDSLGITMDVEYRLEQDVSDLITRLARADLATENPYGVLTASDEEFLRRIYVGVPLFGEKYFSDLQEKINFRKAQLLYASRLLQNYDTVVEDVVGQMHMEDPYNAVFGFQSLLGIVVDVSLLLNAKIFPKSKWRYLLLKRHSDQDMLRLYRSHYFISGTLTAPELRTHLRHGLRFCGSLYESLNVTLDVERQRLT